MKSFEHGYFYDTPISHELLKSIRALGECRGRQVLFQEQSPEILETMRRAAMIQSAESSNRIEGITVAANRLEPLVSRKAKPRDRSEQEVAGYRDVLADIHANHGRLRLSTELILKWHRDMNRYTEEVGGRWKRKENAILETRPDGRQVVRFQPVSVVGTPKYMNKLVSLYHQEAERDKTDPLLLIASFILDFECIHPFWDGNGRIGRLLTLLLLYQRGFEVGRYVSLERIVEESKETYYDALLKSSQGWHDGAHDLGPWWSYFFGTLIAAHKEFEARVGSISSARGAKREMVRNAVLHFHGVFRFADLQRLCPGVSYPTLKRALTGLRRDKVVRCLGRGRDAEWERIGSESR